MRNYFCFGMAVAFAFFAGCQTPPGDEPGGSPTADPTVETEPEPSAALPEEEVERQSFAVSKPKSAPWGSLGGICGVKWSKCQTTAQIDKVFRDMKRSSIKVTKRTKTEVRFQFKTPKLVNDHSGSEDTVVLIRQVQAPELVGALEKALVERNGTIVIELEKHGSAFTYWNIAKDKGGIEAMGAVLANRKFFVNNAGKGQFNYQFENEYCRRTTRGNGDRGDCSACMWATGLGVFTSEFAAAGLGFLLGGPVGAAGLAAAWTGWGAANNSRLDCGNGACKANRCHKEQCECFDMIELIGGDPKMCTDSMKSCCSSQGGSITSVTGVEICRTAYIE